MNILIFFVVCSSKFFQAAALSNSFYTAGVVEFRPIVEGMNSSDILADHMGSYLSILESAEAADIDIIVFPEGTLSNQLHPTYVPSEKIQVIPCLENDDDLFAEFFVQLSCAARRVRKYLVINLTEKENCPSNVEDPRPCASDNLNIFNTNVVFDREGRVVSRYRKVHVYVENKNTTYEPEFAIFDTDFGVRFGHFICFDILFYTPAQELVDRFGITDFIFTTLFYSELPFLTAVQLQQGWAWGNNVNLLAAGASYPEKGTTGSGIYAGELGSLVSVMADKKGERKLYKSRVPIKGSQFIPQTATHPTNNLNGVRLLKDPQIANYKSILLDIAQSEFDFKTKLCDGDVCCNFEVNTKIVNDSESVDFRYRMGIMDGRRTYEKVVWSDIKVCALYACANEKPSSCGEPLIPKNIILKSLNITGVFPKGNKVMIMPSTLNDQLYPLNHGSVFWSKKQRNQHYEVSFQLKQEHINILTFGIYGQYYESVSMAASLKAGNIFYLIFLPLTLLAIFEWQR